MQTLRGRLILFGLVAVSAGALAQQGAAPPQTPPPAAQQPPPASQAPSTPAPPSQTPPRAQRPAGDDIFVPTEELAADEEVTFPVDI